MRLPNVERRNVEMRRDEDQELFPGFSGLLRGDMPCHTDVQS